jgi:iron complex outermembrane receptor protein
MKHFFTLLCGVFITLTSYSQTAKLSGKIVDEKGEGLIQANVVIDASKGLATVTDFDGNYELALEEGTYTVTYRYVGKEEQKLKLTFAAGEKKVQNLTLTDKEKIMDQVVVTGSKYEKKLSEETVSMDVLNNTTLTNQNITSLDNGVQKVPGVTIADGQANIRGGSGWSYGAGTRVSILYDDLLITTADADDAKWSMIPMENIDQVEIIKGAASALYGSGALNGVINARMAYPTDKPYTKITTYAGFYEGPSKTRELKFWSGTPRYFAGVNFADRRKIGQWDMIFGGAYNNDKSYLDSANGQDGRINAKIRYRFKKIEGLNIGANVIGYWSWGTTFFMWDSLGYKGYRPYPGTVTRYDNNRYLVDGFANYFDKHNDKFALKYRYLNSSNINSTGQGSIGQRHIIDFTYQRPWELGKKVKLNFLAGAAGRIDKIDNPSKTDPNYLYGSIPHRAYNASIFAQTDFKFFDRLNVALGARWEYFEIDKQNSLKDLSYPLLRIGINYQAATATYIRGSFGQGFRYPSVAELFVTTALGPLGIYPNEKLKPEKGYSAELGVKQGFQFGKKSNWAGFVDAAGFWNQYQNMMEFTFGSFGDPTDPKVPTFGAGFSSQNIGDTRILGAEILVGVQGKVGEFTLNLAAGYTFIDAKSLNWNDRLVLFDSKGDTLRPNFASAYNNANAPSTIDTNAREQYTYGMTSSSNTNVLKYRPKHQFKLIFNLEHKKFEFNLDYQFISFQENIDYAFVSSLLTGAATAFQGVKNFREDKIANGSKGDHIVNLGIGYKPVEKLKLQFIVKNVLNTEWMPRPGRYEAPRNYTIQMSYQF